MKRTKTYPILVMLAVLVLASLACSLLSGGNDNNNNGGNNGGNVTQNEETSDVGQDEPADTPENSDDGGEETGSISNVKEGLDALDSYTMTYKMTVEGKDADGNPKSGVIEIAEEINRPLNQQRTHFSTQGDAMGETGSMGNFDIYVIGEMTYMYGANEGETPTCMGFSSDDQSSQMDSMDLEDMMGGVDDAKLVKRGETVNGMKVDHYKFDQSGLGFGTFSAASGEYWIDPVTTVVVRYVGEAEGKYTPFGGEIDGKVTWEYSLENVNAGVEIALPAECEGQAPATDIPVPDNATEKSSFGGMITFSSPDTAQVMAEYYKSELPNQGWTAGEDNSMEGMWMFDYTKDNRTISFMITADDAGGCSVVITETKE